MNKKDINTAETKRGHFWQNFFGLAHTDGKETAPTLKFNTAVDPYTYNHDDYSTELFPYQAEIIEGGYEDDWRDALKDIDAGVWAYSTHKDILRRRVIYTASKTSLNSVQLNNPEREAASTAHIEIKQASDRPVFILFKVDNSHLVTNSNYDQEVRVRFDDDDIVLYTWKRNKGKLGSRIDSINLYDEADRFLHRLKTAKYMLIEFCFYKVHGKEGLDHEEVFIFDVSGLEWAHETRRLEQVDSTTSVNVDVDADNADDDIDYLKDFEDPNFDFEDEKFEEPSTPIFAEGKVIDAQNPESTNSNVQIQEDNTDNDRFLRM